MAGTWSRRAFIVLLILGTVIVVENSKLNVPRVLLPVFNSLSLNFTLEGSERECYKWSTSRPEIVSLTPVAVSFGQVCSSKVVVTTATRQFVRNTAIVFAEEIRSRHVVRCDVITDIISSLNVITTTREVFMEDAPEAFEIRAYDAQGNEFSTLEGVEFKWDLSAWNAEGNGAKGTNVIRFMTFNESPYETPPTVQALDNRGLRGHIVLLEGLKTGSARVTVSLPYDEYKRVTPIEVQLSVLSNLIIIPGEAYLMPGDTVQLHIQQVRNGKVEDVELTPQLSWEVEDSSIVEVDLQSGLVTGVAMGKTAIILKDQDESCEKGQKLPTAYITVSSPCYLTLTVLPTRNWAVAIGEDYEIIVEIYDTHDHKLQIGPGVDITTVVPENYFSVKEMSQNGTYIYGEPVVAGTAQVRSTLNSVKDPKGQIHDIDPKISVQANLMIYQRIVVHPADVILPWDPVLRIRYEVKLRAEGGDGSFLWSSENSSIASVTQSGIVTTFSDGHTEVFAAMASNPLNRGVSRFHVAPPIKLEIVEYQLETEVGNSVFLHIALYTQLSLIEHESDSSEYVPLTRCQEVPFYIHVWNEHFEHNSTLTAEPLGIACAVVGLSAVTAGMTKVSVSYEANSLSDSVNIASFLPLKAIEPESGLIVLAVGCSWVVKFQGGPVQWLGHKSEHVSTISTGENSGVVGIEQLSADHSIYEFRVLCKKLGEVEATLTVANVPSVKHCVQTEAVASVRILCAKPRYMTLQTEYVQEEGCPVQNNLERVILQNYPSSKMFVVVKDEYGNIFNNISSLQIDWSLSDPSLAKISQELLTVETVVNVDSPRFYQILKPRKKSGVLELKGTVVDYHAHILRENDIVPEYPPFAILDEKGYEITPEITAVVSIMLVNDTDIKPKVSVLYNHPDNKIQLNLLQGSGYYDLILSTDKVADVSFMEGSRMIEIYPKSEGILKVAVTDRCLPSQPAIAEIHIANLGSMRVESPERVEKGKCVSGILRLLDTIDNVLPVPKPEQLDLRAVFEGNIIGVTIQYDDDPSAPASMAGEIHFVITGIELGDRRLWFISGHAEREVRSQAVPIQVFPPLRLLPHNITMVVGSLFQVTSRGGPQPDANVEFSLSGSMARVDKRGLVEGIALGRGVLVGRAVGYSRVTGQHVVYSQDSIDIFVVALEGIKIHTPITRIINGATVPIWAHGIPDEITPLILGSSGLTVRYYWSISSTEIASLINVYHRIRLAVTNRDLISMHLKTHKPGRVTVALKVTVPSAMTSSSGSQEVEFKTSMEIEVFEELRIIQPLAAGEIQSPYVLMAPNSETVIKTNHEGSEVTFTLLEEREVHLEQGSGTDLSNVMSSSKSVLTVHPDGRIVSHAEYGRRVVQVTVKEDFGLRQIMSITVEVKSVQYMLVSLRPDFIVKETESISNLPRGAEVELFVSYHDNTGVMFTAVEPDIKLRINRFDLTKLTRGTEKNIVLATMMQHGQTMLKVWDEITHKLAADYVRLKTGEGILPRDTVITVGDIICFSVPFVSKDDGGGNWRNDNPAVLELNTELGIGRARSAGTVVVKYHFSETAFTSKEIKVMPVQKVKLLANRGSYITNSDPGALFRVPVILRSEADKSKSSSMISRNGTCPMGYMVSVYPFICSLSFSNTESEYDVDDVFAVHQEFDLDSGEYSCAIEAAGDSPPHLSMLETNLTLNVQSGDISSGPFPLRFWPAVYVSTPEIHLSDAQTGTLIINGIQAVLDDLELVASNAFISVERTTPEVHVISSAVFKVVLSPSYWEVGELGMYMNVSVVSERTKQVIHVPLKIHLSGEKTYSRAPCIVSHVSSWGSTLSDTLYAYRHTLMITTTLLVVLLITAYGYTSFIAPLNELRRDSLLFSPNASMTGMGLTSTDHALSRLISRGPHSHAHGPHRASFGPNLSHSFERRTIDNPGLYTVPK